MKRTFTQSEFATFKLCRFKHFLKYEKGLRRPGHSISALLGRAGHAGLESLYLNGSRKRALKQAEQLFDAHLNEVSRYSPAYNKWRETRDLTTAILSHYCDAYGFNGEEGQDPYFRVIPGMVEFPFCIPVPSGNGEPSPLFELAGKIDLVLERDHRYWVGDHKFKLDVTDSLQDALQINFQMKCYVLALRIYTGLPIAGGFWNVLRRKAPGIPAINKNGTVSLSKVDTTPDIYREALSRQDGFLRETTGKGLDFEKYEKELQRLEGIRWFGRFYCEYSDEDLMEIQREIHETALAIIECSEAGGMLSFKNDLACATFGSCPYHKLCRGVSTGNEFIHDPNPHVELPLVIPTKSLWPGFELPPVSCRLMGFEDAFESVL